MCGIVYGHNIDKKPVNNDIMQIFDKQRTRGLEGFGLFDGQEMNIVRETKEDNILKWLCKYDSNLLMFHHRFPTSTDNVKKAAHPFATKKFFGKHQYILVHNGHITNAKELRTEHEKMGIQYQSVCNDGRFNDSEALLWDLALVLEGRKAKLEAAGGIAFICMRLKKGKLDKLYFGRNYNPLMMRFTKTQVRLSSAGEGVLAERDKLYTYNYKNNKVFTVDMDIPHSTYSYNTVPLTGNNGHSRQPDYTNWNWQNNSYNKRKGEAGDWLPKVLKERYSHLIKQGVEVGSRATGYKATGYNPEADNQFLDYDENGYPVYDSYNDYYEQYWSRRDRADEPISGTVLTEDQQEEAESLKPEMEKVYPLIFHYMGEAEGNFEQAYFFAESDYELLFDVPKAAQDKDYIQGVINLEQVLAEINSDPEYSDENSVSSSWLPLKQQMLLLPA